MHTLRIWIAIAVTNVAVFGGWGRSACGEAPTINPATQPMSVAEGIAKLEKLRAGRQTDFEKVDQVSRQLLTNYPDPADAGLIYFELAFIDSQSGLERPDRTIGFARKALGAPLQPAKKARLELIWGDSLQVKYAGIEQRDQRRNLACEQYVRGLVAVGWLKLPENQPSLPGVPMNDVEPGSPMYEATRKQHDDAVAARETAKEVREEVFLRDVLVQQIAGLYSTNADKLDSELLPESKSLLGAADADALLDRVKARLAKHPSP